MTIRTRMLDAVVVGSGPNGLAAAITIALAGRSVRVYEAEETLGGGMRSAALTKPGFVHDTASTVHALALLSPFLSALPLEEHGLSVVHPGTPFAHPLDDATAVVVHRSVDATADALGTTDGRAYRALMSPLVEHARELMDGLLGPPTLRHLGVMVSFGRHAIRSASGLGRHVFRHEGARAMLAGVAAHSMVPLDKLATAGYALGLTVADRVEALAELPRSRAVLCDVTPRQFLALCGDALPAVYRWRMSRFRYGPGVFKMDWALNAPVPWRAEACNDTGTIHLGGAVAEIAASERDAWEGRVSDRPYVLAVQATRFDPTRAPAGAHTLWAYCHVPHASAVDMRERIEAQIERFAPGFSDCVEARHVMFPSDLERGNANLVGGDIAGGAADLGQIMARPLVSLHPYATPLPGVYLCSSSTPPGVGVHGMCGHRAARAALRAMD